MNRHQRRAAGKGAPASPPSQGIEQLFAEAVRLHQGGRVAEAEGLYRRILSASPPHPVVLGNLGGALQAQGKLDEAVAVYRQAIAVAPQYGEAHYNLGVVLQGQGKLAPAVAAYRQAIALKPDHAEAQFNLGHVLKAQDLPAEAVAAYRQAVAIRPDFAEAWCGLGLALKDEGRVDEAIAACRQAITVRPRYAEAHSNLGTALEASGRIDEAIAAYELAAALDPSLAEPHCNLGKVMQYRGRSDEAAAAYRRAIAAAPRLAAAHYSLGIVLRAQGRTDEAIAAYRQAVACDPRHAEALANLGNALRERGGIDEAIDIYRQAVAVAPHSAVAHSNLGNALIDLAILDEAITACRRAIAIDPRLAVAYSNLGNGLQKQGKLDEAIAAYRQAIAIDPKYESAYDNLLFISCFKDDADPDEVFQDHLGFDRTLIAPFARIQPHANDRDVERRLRIGYLSPDMRMHPGGNFILPMIEHHDRSQVEVFCYYDNVASDDITEIFQAATDHWRPCFNLSDDDLADMIRADRIDILVECAGHMAGSRLIMCGRRKPAPLVISFPLYPNTTGVSAVDYRIMDPHFAPPWADGWHSEALIRMPDAHVCYRPSRSDILPPAVPPCSGNGHVTFGSFNNIAKLGPATLATWARILDAVPGSKLMVKWHGLRRDDSDWKYDLFRTHGIADAQLVFENFAPDPYSSYRGVDIALDPIGANGGTTTCDALWMGVPVVTQFGRTPFSRVGLCHLGNVGLTELITGDGESYVATAVALATDRDFLARMRHGLRQRFAGSPLMDGARYTGHLERGLRIIWRRWCAGEAPAPLAL